VVVLVVASKVMLPAVRPFLTLKFLVATVPYIPVCLYVYLSNVYLYAATHR
jgi:hypothetical protein